MTGPEFPDKAGFSEKASLAVIIVNLLWPSRLDISPEQPVHDRESWTT